MDETLPTLPDQPPQVLPQTTPPGQKTGQRRYIVIGSIGFILMAGLLVVLLQRSGSRPAQQTISHVSDPTRALSPTSNQANTVKNYSGTVFSFTYPNTWKANAIGSDGTYVMLRPQTSASLSASISVLKTPDATLATHLEKETATHVLTKEEKTIGQTRYTIYDGVITYPETLALSSQATHRETSAVIKTADGTMTVITANYVNQNTDPAVTEAYLNLLSTFSEKN